MASSAIIQDSLRTTNAQRFVEKYTVATGLSDYLYLLLAGTTPWVNEVNPPIPTTDLNAQAALWNDIIGAHRIQTNDITLAVPRINWTLGATYTVLDPASQNPWSASTYVLASNNYVYNCVAQGPGTVTTEPTGTGQNVDYGDGYRWDFLYDLSTYAATNLLTTNWLPVNWGPTVSALQASSGDVNAADTLNAKYVLLYAKILDTDLPVNVQYRKLAVVDNPLNSVGQKATLNNYLPVDLTLNSGRMIYTEHRPPITRNAGQFEIIRLTLEF